MMIRFSSSMRNIKAVESTTKTIEDLNAYYVITSIYLSKHIWSLSILESVLLTLSSSDEAIRLGG